MSFARSKWGLSALARLLLVTLLCLACTLQRLPFGLGAADSPTPTDSLLSADSRLSPNAVSTPPREPGVRAGYGINLKGLNYDDDSLDKTIALDFEWVKIYDHPPP
jgi:hypothetical protein